MRRMILVGVVLVLAAGCGYTAPTQPTLAPTAKAGVPASIQLSTQLGAGSAIVRAIVYDGFQTAVPNVSVHFVASVGTVSPSDVTTDAAGAAQTTATAPAGADAVTVSASGLSALALVAMQAQAPLNASLNAPAVMLGTATTLTASFLNGSVHAVDWTFGDGQIVTTPSASVTHQYAVAGNYGARATVYDPDGRTATANTTVVVNAPIVQPTPPAPAPTPTPTPIPITTPTPTPAPAILTATMTCTAAAHTSPSACNIVVMYGATQLLSTTPMSIDWDWGDGSTVDGTSTVPVNSHTYAVPGTFPVTAAVSATTVDGTKTATVFKSLSVL